MGLHFPPERDRVSTHMAAGRKGSWSLEDLVDFEVAVATSPTVGQEVGREIREQLRGQDLSSAATRREGLKRWLRNKESDGGAEVTSATRLIGVLLLIIFFILGVGVVRGLVSRVEGRVVLNIWVFLAGTIGIQWLILIVGAIGFLVVRYWIGGLGWLKELFFSGVRKVAGKVSPKAWQALVQGKGRQPSALGWRLTRMLQLGGVGFNLGLIGGLFGVLWFTEVSFYWESSLSRFGGESLGQVTRILAAPWGGAGLSSEEVAGLQKFPGNPGDAAWTAFYEFVFLALFVWGLVPRVLIWLGAVFKERGVLASLEFQDPAHRKLWREISRVERSVTLEGMKDGVVLLEVGGLNFDKEAIRPFLLRRLRVNPEEMFKVGVLNQKQEQEAWEAMRAAPCGVVILVEGWNLSPKEMNNLFARIRREAGESTVLRVLVMGDGVEAPASHDFQNWSGFIDGLHDPSLECVAYEEE